MTLTKDQMKRLSAYVDGELDPQQQSVVAREVAENPAAARAVASMSALKVGIKNAFTTNEGQIDLDHTGGEPVRLARIAASIAVLAVLGGMGWIYVTKSNGGGDAFAAAMESHDKWQTSETAASKDARTVSNLVMPDLAPAGLTIVSVHPNVALGNRTASHITYLGKRGCRLSLFAYAMSGGNQIRISDHQNFDVLAKGWQVGDLGYLLTARRMNADRFGVLAKAIQESTRKIAPLLNETRLALGKARQPCNA